MKLRKNKLILLAAIVFTAKLSFAQEGIRPLNGNINFIYSELKSTSNFENRNNSKQKTAVSLGIPFKEDFYYASTKKFPDQSLWSDSSTYVNTGHGIAPPSIGVATFDGLDKRGYPYQPNLLNMSMTYPADTLESKPINLYSVGAQTLQPSDSVALTFYYQARGFGDSPELNDSLILDFYKPLANPVVVNPTLTIYGKWESKVWYSKGNPNANLNDTVFKRGFVWISDTAYLHDGFMFRFRNKATTAGDFDHWHLDYIYLNKGRSMIADTFYNDISIGYVPSPYLERYSAMPWEQYTPDDKADRQNVFIRNNRADNMPNMSYQNKMYLSTNSVVVHTYDGGAFPNLKRFKYDGWSTHPNHAGPVFNYTFAPFTDSVDFFTKHYLFTDGISSDFFPQNDTVIQFQKFRNYYAYDDGSAEAAYYVSAAGGKMVMKFKVNVPDTLRALRIYFDPIGSLPTIESAKFRIHLYADNGFFPSVPLLVDSAMNPKYLKAGVNVSAEYTLTTPMVLAPGEYYIGFQQQIASGIGVGFDRNLNHSNYLFYDSGSGWTNSSIPGSIMMNPVFGRKIKAPVGLEQIIGDKKQNSFYVYPNPANNQLIITAKENQKTSFKILNLIGQIVSENNNEENEHIISTENLSNGVYFMILNSGNQLIQQHKIIIQH